MLTHDESMKLRWAASRICRIGTNLGVIADVGVYAATDKELLVVLEKYWDELEDQQTSLKILYRHIKLRVERAWDKEESDVCKE